MEQNIHAPAIGELPSKQVLNRATLIAAAVAAVSARRKEERLIGEGSLSVSPDAPVRVRQEIKQNYQPGRPRAIVLTQYDADWRSGRIGQWVGAYRPPPDDLTRARGCRRSLRRWPFSTQ